MPDFRNRKSELVGPSRHLKPIGIDKTKILRPHYRKVEDAGGQIRVPTAIPAQTEAAVQEGQQEAGRAQVEVPGADNRGEVLHQCAQGLHRLYQEAHRGH